VRSEYENRANFFPSPTLDIAKLKGFFSIKAGVNFAGGFRTFHPPDLSALFIGIYFPMLGLENVPPRGL
jgi:hypothetical protein